MTSTPESYFHYSGTSPPVSELSEHQLAGISRQIRSALPYTAVPFITDAEDNQDEFAVDVLRIAVAPWSPVGIRNLLEFVLSLPNSERAQYRVSASGIVEFDEEVMFDLAVVLILTGAIVKQDDGIEVVHWRADDLDGDWSNLFDSYPEAPKATGIDLASIRTEGTA